MEIKNYKKLYKILLSNGFSEDDCTIERLRVLWLLELRLNRYHLEKASQRQAVVFEKWNNLCEDLSGLMEDERRKLLKLRNRRNLRIRSESFKPVLKKKYNIVETTLKESTIKSLIDFDESVVRQEKKIGFLKIFYSKIRGVVEASKQRKSSIRILTDLYTSNYFDKMTPKQTSLKARRKYR